MPGHAFQVPETSSVATSVATLVAFDGSVKLCKRFSENQENCADFLSGFQAI